jgi:hypothetical protein
MAFQLSIQGRWQLNVTQKAAAFAQRFIIAGSVNADGIYPGAVGTRVEVISQGQQPWSLTIQHNDGSSWADSEIREAPRVTNGSQITFKIESEDIPGSANPDFDDLVLQADKIGEIEIPFRPYALRMDTFQMMADGIFEAALGSYYMGVRVQNVWTQTLPADSLIGISPLGRSLLAAGGIQVIDTWTVDEQEALGQQMSGNRVVMGSLAPWELRTIYFKVNCSAVKPRKHGVEFELVQPAMPDPEHPNRRASQKIFATRSSYNPVSKEFTAECDRGRLSLKLREVTVEYSTLREVIKCVRDNRARRGIPVEERSRAILQDLLAGKPVNLCDLKKLLDCQCDGDGKGQDGDRDRWPCGDLLIFPTKFDYSVEPNPAYTGQFGPLPFDDPWWKVLLIILAIILSVGAGASAAGDLANRSDDVVIGKLFDSKLEPEADGRLLVDAAICELNGNRDLPSETPPLQLLDARSGETFTIPIDALDGTITLSGETMTNLEIANLIATFIRNPSDPAAIEGVRVFKSGARSGTTQALMTRLESISRTDHDGVNRDFKEQVRLEPLKSPDPAAGQATSQGGDSGSIWVHKATRKIVAHNHSGASDDSGSFGNGSRIEDVMNKLNIRFK